MNALPQQTAIVTGAGAGIGQAIARALAATGLRVAVVDIDPTAATRCADLIASEGGTANAILADCGDVASLQRTVAQVAEQWDGVDILVNNAGLTRAATLLDVTEEDWDHINRVNAKGVFFGLQAAARDMVARGRRGRIINIASISGRGYRRSSSAAYAASKGAVIAVTRTAAHQLGAHGICVNAICPGPTSTEMVRQIMQSRASASERTAEDVMAESVQQIPLGRFSTPDEVADLAVFLASPAAANITGQAYNLDGGLVMC